jgi:hypothetical protein
MSAMPEPDGAPELRYRYSYRLFLKEDERGGNAIELRLKVEDCEPVSLDEAEVKMKSAVERMVGDLRSRVPERVVSSPDAPDSPTKADIGSESP